MEYNLVCSLVGIHPKLLFTNRHQIRALHMHESNELYMSLIESKAAVAIDFDYSRQLVFFSDMFEKKLYQFHMPSETEQNISVSSIVKVSFYVFLKG